MMKYIIILSIFVAITIFPNSARSFNVSGKVIHEINNTPIENIGVLLVSSQDSTKFYHVKTSGDGTFSISGVSVGKYYLHADGGIGDFRAEEYLYAKTWYPNSKTISGATLLNVNKDLSSLTITLSGHYIKGSVTDLATNNPLFNIVIRLYNQKWVEIQSINTKGDKYCFGSLPQGNFYVGYTDADYMTQYYDRVTEKKSATILKLDNQKFGLSDINFLLSSGISVSGKVTTSTGSVVANTSVALLTEPALDWWNYGLSDRDAWTNASGEYTIRGIESGDYYLIATGRVIHPVTNEEQQLYPPVFYNNTNDPSQAQKIQIHTSLNHFDFVLDKGYSISGKAYCIDGTSPVPIPNLWIYVVLPDETYVNMTLTDSNGAFCFDGLASRDYVVFTHGNLNDSMDEVYQRRYYNGANTIQDATRIHLDRDFSNIDLMLHTLNYNPGDTTNYNPGDTTVVIPGDTTAIPGIAAQTALPKPWFYTDRSKDQTRFYFPVEQPGPVRLTLYTANGKMIQETEQWIKDRGIHCFELSRKEQKPGIYILVIGFDSQPPLVQKFQQQ